MNLIQTQLLELLADGQFHSGEALGTALGVSRMAVHKRIDSLAALGLDIFRVNRKGYRLAQPLQLLDKAIILHELPPHIGDLHVHHITSSTNDDLRLLLKQEQVQPGLSVIAEMQTAGRGRRGKPWQSPFGCNLYLSMYWPLLQGLNAAIGMSVTLGVALAKLLQKQGIEGVSIKWPNDVYIAEQKVAGILVELEGQADGEGQAIVGVGLNLMMPPNQEHIDQPFTSVQEHLSSQLNRNQWAALLIEAVYSALQQHDAQGLQPTVAAWPQFDRFYKQPVEVILGQHKHEGIACGIDEMGAFLVEQEGVLKRYFGGEVSVRSK
ncbi:bifunctional biotin--[acetyl-CoA-carboxylase] synthetase/biotin operon repressor [Aliidiomarina taiwanensis]|uniref:Bifunctional ligase/repressor BirA n=1 Tax=Aliidiomarina taiwanensis TaxID=946228 RepID=A0A432X0C3_9GAMM|nr:bifunctional biotin--[acetyl-CoA-carboxylase] ligase/biotin operon repressor BirA [Aliidiomarina taiwanensis]RUO39382.1 bifunctional biotin--[acetyl-CoA-carboxylase] synthetase/biotin operon repressor [Aliidiomarina taiwanensis]